MTKVVQQPGSIEESVLIRADRQLAVDLATRSLVLHDGVTAGGDSYPNLPFIMSLIGKYTNRTGGTEKIAASATAGCQGIQISGWFTGLTSDSHQPSWVSGTSEWVFLHIESISDAWQFAYNEDSESAWRHRDDTTWGSWVFTNANRPNYNAIDSYAFLTNAGTTTAPGSTLAGSNLTPAAHDATTTSTARSGSWKARGNGVTSKATLWVRTL